jgi:transcriptional regulator with XRE-family HTH domain
VRLGAARGVADAVVTRWQPGALLRSLREQRGLSLRELGRLTEIDHAYIHRLETGAKEAPSDKVILNLTRALKANKQATDRLLKLRWRPVKAR